MRSIPIALTLLMLGCSGNVTHSTFDAGLRPDSAVVDLAGAHDASVAPDSAANDLSAPIDLATTPHDAGPTKDAHPAVDAAPPSLFPLGTICNNTGKKLTPPTTLKHLIIVLLENENFGNVNGNAAAPYVSSLATACGYATKYNDNCFTTNYDSLPHYLALTSGSNCDTGLNATGTGCITDDNDATSHQLTTQSIFAQVSSWKAYQEGMPSTCDLTSSGEYACKHNPPAYYSTLSSCSADDVSIASITCNATTTKTACTAPSNALTQDLADDTLAAYSFVTPNLLNDMHDGTVTQSDNWLFTYLPLVFASKAYLRGDVAVLLLWDEQSTADSGGATPNVFISPYVTAGTVSTTAMNHFSVLRATENALGITTYLGCASGTQPGGGTCPSGSTANVRSAMNF